MVPTWSPSKIHWRFSKVCASTAKKNDFLIKLKKITKLNVIVVGDIFSNFFFARYAVVLGNRLQSISQVTGVEKRKRGQQNGFVL
jgi:hypothetical protein